MGYGLPDGLKASCKVGRHDFMGKVARSCTATELIRRLLLAARERAL
jgi:hypothetical protein